MTFQMKTVFFSPENEASSNFTKSDFLKTGRNLVYHLANRWGYVYTYCQWAKMEGRANITGLIDPQWKRQI